MCTRTTFIGCEATKKRNEWAQWFVHTFHGMFLFHTYWDLLCQYLHCQDLHCNIQSKQMWKYIAHPIRDTNKTDFSVNLMMHVINLITTERGKNYLSYFVNVFECCWAFSCWSHLYATSSMHILHSVLCKFP